MRFINILAVALAMFVSACNYSHVGLPVATFTQPMPPPGAGSLQTQAGALTLRIQRHLDTVLQGPDNEEDQLLVLEVRGFEINRRLRIPSDDATCTFTATRFGPTSNGQVFTGYLIVRKVTPHEVDAYVHIDVTASTPSGSYTQTAKFHGDYAFVRSTGELSGP